jgi:5-methylcytosine-specific restriction endonuclease McrA
MNIKETKTDKLLSRERRLMRAGICDRCHKIVGIKKLQTAHFHSRRKRSVRYDPFNVAVLCFTCHQYLDSEPLEKVEFFRKRMTSKEFDDLNKRANTPKKWTKQEIEELEVDLKNKIRRLE